VYETEKSDVPHSTKETAEQSDDRAEAVEGRRKREENMRLDNTPPTQSGGSVSTQGVSMPPFKSGYGDEVVGELGAGVPNGLERVRQAAITEGRSIAGNGYC
jgi:hypothetical protein